MNPSEYETMFHVEDWHWWYRGLRAVLKQSWNAYVPQDETSVLDIGCGTGAHLALLSKKNRAFGVDLCTHAIGLCRERKLASTTVGSAISLPIQGGSFDAVVCTDVLYHRAVTDPVLALREAHRVLKTGGLLFLNVPAYEWLRSSHDKAIHTERRFTRPGVRAALQDAGFESLRVTYWNTLLFPAVAVARLLRRSAAREESDFHKGSGAAVGGILSAILTVERQIMRFVDLPFGVSIFAVARKV